MWYIIQIEDPEDACPSAPDAYGPYRSKEPAQRAADSFNAAMERAWREADDDPPRAYIQPIHRPTLREMKDDWTG